MGDNSDKKKNSEQPSPTQNGTETGSGGQRAPTPQQGPANPPSNIRQRGEEGKDQGQQYFLFQG